MYTYFDADGPVVTFADARWAGAVPAQIHDAPGAPHNVEPHDRTASEDHRRTHRGVTITTPHWVTCFEIHHGQVPEYRHGRVFLAGDAAHIHSPPVPGMNTGNAGRLQPVLEARGGDQGRRRRCAYWTATTPSGIPVGKRVIDFTSTLTKIGTLKGLARVVRNAVSRSSPVPPAVRVMASNITETKHRLQEQPRRAQPPVCGMPQ